MESVVSVVTQAVLVCGLARKGHPAVFANLIREFFFALRYCLGMGQPSMAICDHPAPLPAALGALDMMIAAHAIAAKATLATRDKAFSLVPGGVLAVEDWIVQA